MNTLIRFGALLVLAFLLTACFGSSGTVEQEVPAPGTPGAPQATPGEVSGQVMNSYLKGAGVCVDVDYDNSCDSSEPQHSSSSQGNFNLASANNYSPMLAHHGGTGVTAPGTRLTAPANALIISPLTTLFHARLVQNLGEFGMSPNAAHAQALQDVQDAMGIHDFNPLVDDYGAISTANALKASQIASTMNIIMQRAQATALTHGLQHQINDGHPAVLQHVTREAFKKLSDVAADVSERVDGGQTVDVFTLAQQHAVSTADLVEDSAEVLSAIKTQIEKAKDIIENGSRAAGTISTDDESTKVTVSSQAGENGEITPSSVSVIPGNITHFTVTPDSGYRIDSVSGCDGGLPGTTYTTGEITGACTVEASFIPSDAPGELTRICVNGQVAGQGTCPEEPLEAGISGDEWGCTLDSATGLVWAVNMFKHLFEDASPDDPYLWYDPNPNTNGGVAGAEGNWELCNGTLGIGNDCNSHNYIDTANKQGGVCGSVEWRLPTREELLSLWNEDDPDNFTIDDNYFPNLGPEFIQEAYLTSETSTENADEFWAADPRTGATETRPKAFGHPTLIWLVYDPTP